MCPLAGPLRTLMASHAYRASTEAEFFKYVP